MKLRTGFVSNSSSSSFICTPNDACSIELFNEAELLSLHEYLAKFGERDIFDEWWYRPKKIKFVSDSTFCKNFASGVANTLPLSAKKMYEICGKDWSSLLPFVENALQPMWGKTKFEYYEAEDCAHYSVISDSSNNNDDEYGLDDWESNEESYLSKLFGESKMKFSRVFSNH